MMDHVRDRPSSGEEIVYSTAGAPARDRARSWRDMVCRAFPSLNVDWLDARPIHANLVCRRFADAWVTEITNTPVRVSRSSSLSRAHAGDGSYLLVRQLAECGRYAHAGVESLQRPGDLVLLDTSLAFDSAFPSGLHVLVWELPRAILAPLLANPDRAVGHRIDGATGPGAVLGDHALALARESDWTAESLRHTLAIHLCGLVALVLGASATADASAHETYRSVRRQQILGYIEAHLGDSNLTVGRAAQDLRMSRRWLHTLFDSQGASFAAWVTQRRLEECHRILENPAYDERSVADVAFLWGFRDLSTFNRRFVARYQTTPREIRKARRRWLARAADESGTGGALEAGSGLIQTRRGG